MQLKLELTNDIRCISPTLSFVDALCRDKGFSEKENKQLQIALEEVLSNTIQYAFDSDEEHSFDVLIRETSSFVEIKIREFGVPFLLNETDKFDPSRIHDADDAINQKGLGTYLISHLVDKLDYRYMGVKGKETTLTKYTSNPQVEASKPNLVEMTSYSPEDVKVHLFEEKEALSLARCIYSTYGYTYLKYALYEPNYLSEISKRKDTILITATLPDGTVGGVVIGKEDENIKGIIELSTLIVSPQFRGLHISEKLGSFLREEVIRGGYNGLYAECVSIHLASQKSCGKVGLKPCLILLNIIPNSVQFKKFDTSNSERQSFIVQYLKLTDKKSQIYMPASYSAAIERIYKRIDVEFELLTRLTERPEKSSIVVERNDILGLGSLFVQQIGDDMGIYLQKVLKSVEFESTKTWCLYLNMTDSQLDYGIEQAKESCFVFSGILPGGNDGDLLLMQNLTHSKWVRDEILLAEPEQDTWMLDFIEEELKTLK